MKKTHIIGIAGGSGSGKSTLVRRLHETFGEQVACIAEDSYYRSAADLPPETAAAQNYDCPEAIETSLLTAHLDALSRGETAEIPVYDFRTHTRTKETRTVSPAPVILVEGILVFTDEALRSRFDIRIFVDADADIRILRRMERDVKERGRTMESVIAQYLATVRPMHEKYVAPSRRYADLIIPEGGENRVARELLEDRIRALLRA